MTSKLVTTLTNNIYNNVDFRNDYRDLLLSKFAKSDSKLTDLQLKRLIESASILALNQNDIKSQKIAFKIVIFLLETVRNKYEFLPYLSQIILARLGDLPTIQHMITNDNSKDYFSFFNTSELEVNHIQLPEITSSKIFNQVKIGNIEYALTDFQSRILITLQKKFNVSFSAPTSAGKSFIVHQFIAEQFQNYDTYCVVYVAPTKSLIKEVQDKIKLNLKNFGDGITDVLIFNSVSRMNADKIMKVKKKILVMTQERLQQMVSSENKINVNLLIVDEAQKVSEDERGVIIEDAVYDLMSLNPTLQKVFISPNSDPNRFKQIFNIVDKLDTFKTTKTPVGQNFFDVKFSKDPKQANLSIWSYELDENIPLYFKEIDKKTKMGLMSTRKAWVVANIIQRKDPTLVYCNTRKDCRTVCKYISEYSKELEISEELKKSIDFIKTHVHSEYYLLDYLGAGIGYHYGKMPHFVRLVVKELYENKEIDTLCCTSTLIEGVNLPAKNIVLYNPKLGNRIFMNRTSLNNVAGRAGRLLKDYYGDIYCIDRKEWEDEDPFNPENEIEPVESATEKILSKKTSEILKYLENPLIPINDTNRGARSVAINLMTKYLQVPNIDDYLEIKCKTLDPEIKQQIIDYLYEISNTIKDLNDRIILKNRGIDPRFQHKLYEFLKIPGNLVLPPFPDNESFYDDLLQIFKIIARIIFNQDHKQYIYVTALATKWINGFPYKQLLTKKIKLNTPHENESHKTFVNRMIDELDDDIETKIKFEYTRALQCYCDIVEQILYENESSEIFCVNLPEYLEAGAWDHRIFLLMDVGFTRTSALYLYNKLDLGISEVTDCLTWLRENRTDVLEWLPVSLHLELNLILDKS